MDVLKPCFVKEKFLKNLILMMPESGSVDGDNEKKNQILFRTSHSPDILFLYCRSFFIHPSKQIVLNVNFSSRTTSLDVQKTIEAAVEKRTKNIFGPALGKKLIVFVDDMNMPKVDNYGTQQPIALLKLLFENGGMYDRGKDLNWKLFKDMCKCKTD